MPQGTKIPENKKYRRRIRTLRTNVISRRPIAVPSFPLRTGQHRRAAPFRPRTAARPSAVDAFATGYQPMRTLLQVPKNRSAADRPGVPFRTNRLAATPARSHRPAQSPRMQYARRNRYGQTVLMRSFFSGASFLCGRNVRIGPDRSRFCNMLSTGKRRAGRRASCQREGCRGKAVSGTLKSIAAESYFSNRSIRSRNSISRRMLSTPVISASTRRSATYLPPV